MTSEQEQQALSDFQSLNKFEKSLLILLSIIYEPVSQTFLMNLLSKAEAIVPALRRPTKEELQASITRLRKLGLLDENNCCSRALVEQLTRKAVAREIFSGLASLIDREAPVSFMYGKWNTRCWRAMRQFRFGIYSLDFDRIDESQAFLEEHCQQQLDNKSPAVLVAAEAFDPDWFGSLPGSMQFFLLDQVFRYSVERLIHYQPVITYLEDEKNLTISPDEQVPFHRLLAGYYLLQGRFLDLQDLLTRHDDSFKGSGFAGTLALLL
jgi:hypothetical protein